MIKEMLQSLLRARIIKVWEEPKPKPQTMTMGGRFVGRYLLLGDDKSIQDFERQS